MSTALTTVLIVLICMEFMARLPEEARAAGDPTLASLEFGLVICMGRIGPIRASGNTWFSPMWFGEIGRSRERWKVRKKIWLLVAIVSISVDPGQAGFVSPGHGNKWQVVTDRERVRTMVRYSGRPSNVIYYDPEECRADVAAQGCTRTRPLILQTTAAEPLACISTRIWPTPFQAFLPFAGLIDPV